jgi:hypothetical protein
VQSFKSRRFVIESSARRDQREISDEFRVFDSKTKRQPAAHRVPDEIDGLAALRANE